MTNEVMCSKRTWEEFRESKLLWWVNRTLHLFGWSIVIEIDDNEKVIDTYPARVGFRGFDEGSEADGFIGLTEYLKKNVDDLSREVSE